MTIADKEVRKTAGKIDGRMSKLQFRRFDKSQSPDTPARMPNMRERWEFIPLLPRPAADASGDWKPLKLGR